MSRTPEVMIDKSRKSIHDFFEAVAVLAGLVAFVGFFSGGGYALALVVSIGCAISASKIKFKLVKRAEAASYDYI